MNIKKILIFGGGALLLVGTSVGASLFFTGAFNEKEAPVPILLDEDGNEIPPPIPKPVAEPLPALPEEVFYHPLQPEFVVNFYDKSRIKFMMIEMVVGTYDSKLLPILKDHDPEIRDAILTMLSSKNGDSLKTTEGKQAIREEAIERLDDIIGRYYRTGRLKDVYITRLVMQ